MGVFFVLSTHLVAIHGRRVRPAPDRFSSGYGRILETVGSDSGARIALDLRGTSLTEADVRAALRANRISGLAEVITLTDRGLGRAFP